MNANVVIDGSICIPYAYAKFDEKLNFIDDISARSIDVLLMALERAIEKT